MTEDEFINDDGDEQEESLTLPSKKDVALWRRALRENWPMSAEDRNMIVRDLMDYFILAKSGRDKINAAKALFLADSLNVKRASMIGAASRGGHQASTNVNVTVGMQVTESLREALDHDPEYLKFLERRLLESDPVDVGQNGHGALPNSGTHPTPERSRNGHHHGNGRNPSSNGHDAAATREE